MESLFHRGCNLNMIEDNFGFLPTSKKEVESLGWDYIDVILFTGDAYIDHPSFGTAVISRYLQKWGYRVAIIPQPNWRDDLRDFKKLGAPRLFFGVNSGVMDSMVNHYTAAKRLRSNDAYTPMGRAGQRPDYAVTVYSNILKSLYPDVPVIIGGVEASLRRVAHYDYWQDRLFKSILFDSKADFLVYGMGELAIKAIAEGLENGDSLTKLRGIRQLGYISDSIESRFSSNSVTLHSYEKALKDKRLFAENFAVIERESNSYSPSHIIEPYSDGYVHINPPFQIQEDGFIDDFYDLPYKREPHFRYKGKHIPAYEMIKFSLTTHRGCFGSCSFCTISAHQGKFVLSRSEESILNEIQTIASQSDFKGVISDIGGPTANMYKMKGINSKLCEKCKKDSCLFPVVCKNLNISHKPLLNLYDRISKTDKLKRFFISSGIRYDLFLNHNSYLDSSGKEYLERVIKNHTSGRLKVAPEHTEEHVLKVMGKPSFKLFSFLRSEFEKITKKEKKSYQLIPYFISSHPGCTMEDMKSLSLNRELKGLKLEQVQDFTPTPMTRSSVAYYTNLDPKTLKNIYVEKNMVKKQKQKSYFLDNF